MSLVAVCHSNAVTNDVCEARNADAAIFMICNFVGNPVQIRGFPSSHENAETIVCLFQYQLSEVSCRA